MKLGVPSMGSTTQSDPSGDPLVPYSSPRIPCSGYWRVISRRSRLSAARSASVTGLASSLVSIVTGVRNRSSASAPACRAMEEANRALSARSEVDGSACMTDSREDLGCLNDHFQHKYTDCHNCQVALSFGKTTRQQETPMKTAILRTLSPLAIAAAASSPAWAGDLTLYTALEAEEIEAYIAAAEADLPDITFNVLRLS